MTPYLADTPVLETERLTLRAIGRQDMQAISTFLSSDRSKTSGGPFPKKDHWRTLSFMIGQWVARGIGSFVFSLKGGAEVLGDVSLYSFTETNKPPQIGWNIWSAGYEGNGYAFEAVKAARAYAYEEHRWPSAISLIAPENTRSIALAKRLGAIRDHNAPGPSHPQERGKLAFRHPIIAHFAISGGRA